MRGYLSVLRRQRVVIVAVMCVAVAVALVYSVIQEPTYTASASLAFADDSQDLGALGTPVAPAQQPDKLAAAQAETVTGPTVLERVRRSFARDRSTQSLRDSVSAHVEPDSNLVLIEASASSAVGAAGLANEVASQTRAVLTSSARRRYAAAARRLRRQLAGTRRRRGDTTGLALSERISTFQSLSVFARPVEVTKTADPPGSPSSPKPLRDVVLGLTLGLVLGILLGFARESLDRRLRSPDEIHEQFQFPMLSFVREQAMGLAGGIPNGHGSLEEADVEGFRILRTNLDFLDVDRRLKSVIITSALPEEGKTTVAASLAYASAIAGHSTLLVECDLRRPTLADRLGLASSPGLTDYLAGKAGPKEILQRLEVAPPRTGNGAQSGLADIRGAPLVCITSGTTSPQPGELLGSERFRGFLEDVTQAYDQVVIDTPPLLAVADTLELVPLADGVVVCVRVSSTTRDQARAAKAALAHVPARPTGLVVTGMTARDESEYGYGAYGYAYGDQAA